ncbi:hypothetical protein N7E81_16915 [Reichenbachiella carrageenanivorans]|uniref:Transmembrane protein n=1 Tax=Reichenbachiella carrageenanivorans TaxID=2979869 RepID=A0ABY6D1S5_9BACT|nr:hypothetical protein [Reichenbachiella carrageenanivorans]UXX79038.1 hypothetical protein N7E81_16915 [Reichenbachiella carrageenanivorans]
MKTVKYPLVTASVFLWIGFVGAISFMEAWLKFQAPGITVTLGLGIGRLVFFALNKVEWVLALAIAISYLANKEPLLNNPNGYYWISVVLLTLQTVWLLPVLDHRAELLIQGIEIPSAPYHLIYVGTEIVKISSLIIFGIKQFRAHLKNAYHENQRESNHWRTGSTTLQSSSRI